MGEEEIGGGGEVMFRIAGEALWRGSGSWCTGAAGGLACVVFVMLYRMKKEIYIKLDRIQEQLRYGQNTFDRRIG